MAGTTTERNVRIKDGKNERFTVIGAKPRHARHARQHEPTTFQRPKSFPRETATLSERETHVPVATATVNFSNKFSSILMNGERHEFRTARTSAPSARYYRCRASTLQGGPKIFAKKTLKFC